MFWQFLFITVLHQLLISSTSDAFQVGLLNNTYVIINTSSNYTFADTLQQCLCRMRSDSQWLGFNYFPTSSTCQFYLAADRDRVLNITQNVTASFYFSLSPSQTTEMITDSTFSVTTAPSPNSFAPETLMWTFDGTFNDRSQIYNGSSVNNVTFSDVTVTGYGPSVSFHELSSQAVMIDSPFLPLPNRSWTFEAWIYPDIVQRSNDYGIIGQCDDRQNDRCLHITIRNGALYFGFYNDDLPGVQLLNSSTWYHVAFAFDCATRNQSLYLNGVLETSRQANNCYEGVNGSLTIGRTDNDQTITYFNGSIDQLVYSNRSKTAEEILIDATLALYYSFDNQSLNDRGPLQINATPTGNVSFSSGRVGSGLHGSNVSDSYLLARNLVLLGTSRHAYSISMWIQPARIQQASLFHLSATMSSCGGWCLSLLGLSDSGQLVSLSWTPPGAPVHVNCSLPYINRWSHVGLSYSQRNGLSLYINGTMCSSSAAFDYNGPGPTNFVFIGGTPSTACCYALSFLGGQYEGDIDEVRIYSRELTSTDMAQLASVP